MCLNRGPRFRPREAAACRRSFRPSTGCSRARVSTRRPRCTVVVGTGPGRWTSSGWRFRGWGWQWRAPSNSPAPWAIGTASSRRGCRRSSRRSARSPTSASTGSPCPASPRVPVSSPCRTAGCARTPITRTTASVCSAPWTSRTTTPSHPPSPSSPGSRPSPGSSPRAALPLAWPRSRNGAQMRRPSRGRGSSSPRRTSPSECSTVPVPARRPVHPISQAVRPVPRRVRSRHRGGRRRSLPWRAYAWSP